MTPGTRQADELAPRLAPVRQLTTLERAISRLREEVEKARTSTPAGGSSELTLHVHLERSRAAAKADVERWAIEPAWIRSESEESACIYDQKA